MARNVVCVDQHQTVNDTTSVMFYTRLSVLWPYDMNGLSGLNLFIYIPKRHSAELNME